MTIPGLGRHNHFSSLDKVPPDNAITRISIGTILISMVDDRSQDAYALPNVVL